MRTVSALLLVGALSGLSIFFLSGPFTVAQDGVKKEAPREGDVKRDAPRDGDAKKPGPRDGDPRRPGPREGAPREGAPREGAPREGARDGGEGGIILCVVPLSKAPEADVVAALDKIFGKQLKITVENELKVIVLQGPEAAVAGAVQGLRDSIDSSRPAERRREGDAEGPERAIEVVRLYKAKSDVVIKLVKQHVLAKVEITERPSVQALIIEGDRAAVEQAASLARQIDGQLIHPSLRRFLAPPVEREGR